MKPLSASDLLSPLLDFVVSLPVCSPYSRFFAYILVSSIASFEAFQRSYCVMGGATGLEKTILYLYRIYILMQRSQN
jgi:hypothetical protein